jgi:hypothetical protein
LPTPPFACENLYSFNLSITTFVEGGKPGKHIRIQSVCSYPLASLSPGQFAKREAAGYLLIFVLLEFAVLTPEPPARQEDDIAAH